MSAEAELELYYATRLAMNVGDGLKTLRPASVNAGIKQMGGIPMSFTGLREWSRQLVDAMCEKHPKKLESWGDPHAEDDVETYVSRKIWEYKVANGTFLNPSAASIAAMTHLARYARAQSHEAINHSIKHNEDIAHLLTEMHDHIDQVLLSNFNTEIGKVAGALVSLHPEISGMIAANQKVLTHDDAA
jgi:hypothetical protein